MGRSPCCDKVGLKKGPWTPEEDQKLLAYIEQNGHGSWRALPAKAGLQRCGKSCRLRWTNYLRPDIKRGKFSLQEEQTIIQLHALLGNRWSAIATHLPKRTDNEIKNYWNTHLKKRLTKMGIDPVTHKPKTDALGGAGSCNPKDAANLSHMAQWESARLEAEARLVRESNKLLLNHNNSHLVINNSKSTTTTTTPPALPCLDVLRAWQGAWTKLPAASRPSCTNTTFSSMFSMDDDLESPTSTLTSLPLPTLGFSAALPHAAISMPEINDVVSYDAAAGSWFSDVGQSVGPNVMMDDLADMFAYGGASAEQIIHASDNGAGMGCGINNNNPTFEDSNKSYWNSILNLIN